VSSAGSYEAISYHPPLIDQIPKSLLWKEKNVPAVGSNISNG